MTIPDEAVRSAPERIWTCNETKNIWIGEQQADTVEYVRADLAAPFLTGVKVDVDALAQEIRRVDGKHNKGAGELAEALIPYLSAIEPSPSPRAQALEEAAKEQLLKDADWLGEYGHQLSEEECEHHDGGYTANRLTAIGERIDAAIRALSSQPVADAPFQDRVKPWMLACFGEDISNDKLERCDRLIEEALELAQAIGYSADRSHALVDYVFNRDIGEPHQEVGGVMVTLAALCLASGLDMNKAGEDELARIWTKVDKIRAKQAAKPTGSALPIALPASPGASE